MSDLNEYLTLKNRIEELEKQVKRLKQRNAEWKCKYKKVAKKGVLVTRTSKARDDIKRIKQEGFKGTVIAQIKQVAKTHYLSVGHVTDIWYK